MAYFHDIHIYALLMGPHCIIIIIIIILMMSLILSSCVSALGSHTVLTHMDTHKLTHTERLHVYTAPFLKAPRCCQRNTHTHTKSPAFLIPSHASRRLCEAAEAAVFTRLLSRDGGRLQMTHGPLVNQKNIRMFSLSCLRGVYFTPTISSLHRPSRSGGFKK